MSKVFAPDYFENFVCKCGECRHPCCYGWRINISEKEYFTLLGLKCNQKLRNRIDDALKLSDNPSEKSYAYIHPNYLGCCPVLNKEGLCQLQREKGEEILPLICRLYPRSVKRYGERTEICMSCSCEKTVELLMKEEKPLTLHEAETDLYFNGLEVYGNEPEKERMRSAIIAVMSDASLTISKRLGIIGMFCCGAPLICEGRRTDAVISLKKFIEVLCKKSESIREYGEKVLSYLDTEDETELLDRFNKAEKHLYDILPQVETFAGRIISNHILYESFPYNVDCESPDTAFAAFCTAVGILKMICVCGMAESEDINEFVDILSFTNRFIEHSDYYKICSRANHPKGMEVYAKFAPIFTRA